MCQRRWKFKNKARELNKNKYLSVTTVRGQEKQPEC